MWDRGERGTVVAMLRAVTLLTLLALAAITGTAATPAPAAAPRADLTVKAVTAPSKAAAGGRIAVSVDVRNAARRRAPSTALAFSLSRDARPDRGDVKLGTATRVRALRARRSTRPTATVAIPRSTKPGRYWIVACADPAGRVKERSERNNCRASAKPITITARGAATPPGPLPGAGTSPVAAAAKLATQALGVVGAKPREDKPGGKPSDPPPAEHPDFDPEAGTGAGPDPEKVAPPVPARGATDLGDAMKFLYEGENAIQKDVEDGAIAEQRLVVLRGRAITRADQPLAGVRVEVLDHPELGYTLTQADGGFDIAVNGGGAVTLAFSKDGYVDAQREVDTPWKEVIELTDDVALVKFDKAATAVDLDAATPYQVHRATESDDSDGERRATLLFEQGTEATMELPNGSEAPLEDLTVRATEFTVGDNGDEAMPGELPATSGYTYAVEMSVDQAVKAGATDVKFTKPVINYTENFLGFPAGEPVPTGYYDREKGDWVPSKNGRVIKILDESADTDADGAPEAAVDTDGDGLADEGLGIDVDERERLAQLYDAGQSLWRVEMTHFTPWDHNWPYGPPPGARGPNQHRPDQDKKNPKPKKECYGTGSIIGCQTQRLGETIGLAGVPSRLAYWSDRVPGRADERSMPIPLTGGTLPPGLRRIELIVTVAGRKIQRSFPAAPNLTHQFTWDGKDAYGRQLRGEHPVTVKVGFTYGAVYYRSRTDFDVAFGRTGVRAEGGGFGRDQTRQEVTLWTEWRDEVAGTVGLWDARQAGLGGWTFAAHHAYDSVRRVAHLGDGSRINIEPTITSIAGTPEGAPDGTLHGDGGKALDANLHNTRDIEQLPDGSILFTEDHGDTAWIRRIAPDGTISTFAGGGTKAPLAGTLATEARIRTYDLTVLADGDVLFPDPDRHKVLRVDAETKLISVFAGSGGGPAEPPPPSGDGGPATAARVIWPRAVEAAADGSVFIVDMKTVRRVLPNGIIETYAGGGQSNEDGIDARQLELFQPADVAVGPDGAVYVSHNFGSGDAVTMIAPDGTTRRVAGVPDGTTAKGPGNPAREVFIRGAEGLAVHVDGSLLIADYDGGRVWRVNSEGIANVLAGNGATLPPEAGDGGPAPGARLPSPEDIAVTADGAILVTGGWGGNRIRRIGRPFPETEDGRVTLPSRDGGELYTFDAEGKHLETRDGLTNALKLKFEYDGEGRLAKMVDADGLETRIERADGKATAIVAPGGQRTELTIGESGYLERVENPADEAVALEYAGGGLLKKLTEPGGGVHQYEHDGQGRLLTDTDPLGGKQTLERTVLEDGYRVTLSTKLGRKRIYEVRRLGDGATQLSSTERDGSTTIVLSRADGSVKTTYPSGMTSDAKRVGDPRWDFAVPLLAEQVDKTPGGKTRTTTQTRTVALADPGDPLSLQTLTDKLTVNGKVQTTVFDAAARTVTKTTAGGRTSVTTFDAKGRVTKSAPHGVAPIDYVHDDRGRVQSVTQGDQKWTFTYDARDRVETRKNALDQVTRFGYDDADRITSVTAPDQRVTAYEYDDDGNRTAIVMPDGKRHAMTHTKRSQLESFTPFGSSSSLSKSYDDDGRLDAQTLPGGAVLDTQYDDKHRPSGVAFPEGTATVGFKPGTSLPTSVTRTPAGGGAAEGIAYDYDGDTPTKTTIAPAGTTLATFDHTYGNDLLMASAKLVSGTFNQTWAIARDDDGLATGYGPFTLARSGPGGAISAITDTKLSATFGYDDAGVPSSRQTTVNAKHGFGVTTTFDAGGRVASRVEKIGTEEHTFTYTYDDAGRLREVKRDGVVVETYGYDDNGNRTSRKIGNGAVEAATYDTQQRLETRGDVAYEFSASGHMTKRGNDTFTYSARGELLSATVGSTTVEYRYDGLGRRTARIVGNDTTRYLYGNPSDPFEVTGVRSPSGTVTRYFYDEQGLLFAMQRGNTRFYIATDQVGTPRAVLDTNGNAVKRMELDAFGAPVSDSAPSFDMPFGFAGGLADPVTGLVRFGARDYEPASGRWTARDPALFEGGQVNLYSYVGNEPVAHRDPTGLFCVGGSVYGGFGGGASFCINDEGFSVCVEAGLGVGTDIDVDLFGDVAETGTAVVAEAKLQAGPASVKIGAELDNTGCLSGGWETELFNLKIQNGEDWTLKHSVDAEVVGAPAMITKAAKAGLVAKVAAKFCQKASL